MIKTDKTKSATMPLVDHFMEFKKRFCWSLAFFIFTFAICWTYREFFLRIFTYPLVKNSTVDHLIFTKLTEAFTSYIHIIFLAALVFSLPFLIAQVWAFLSPALSKNEKTSARGYTLTSLLLFFTGAVFAYFVIIPLMLDFFLGFQNFVKSDASLSLYVEPKISEYIGTIQSLLMAFGIAFQLPIALVLCVKSGIFSLNDLRYNRKYALLTAFIAGAVLTPPDVVSQVMLALPLLILYEASIWFLSFTSHKWKFQNLKNIFQFKISISSKNHKK